MPPGPPITRPDGSLPPGGPTPASTPGGCSGLGLGSRGTARRPPGVRAAGGAVSLPTRGVVAGGGVIPARPSSGTVGLRILASRAGGNWRDSSTSPAATVGISSTGAAGCVGTGSAAPVAGNGCWPVSRALKNASSLNAFRLAFCTGDNLRSLSKVASSRRMSASSSSVPLTGDISWGIIA